MQLRLSDARLLPLAAAALAGGLAAAALYVWFLGGPAFCTGEAGRICWVGLGSALLFFLCGASLRGVISSWLRVRSRGFRQLYALNVLLGSVMAAAVFWLFWDVATGPSRAAVCAGGLVVLAMGLLVFLNHAAEDDRSREMAGLARRLGLVFSLRDARGLGTRFGFSRPFGLTPGGAVRNLAHGALNGRVFMAFDYVSPRQESPAPSLVGEPLGPRPGPANDLNSEMTVAAFSFPDCCMPGCLVVSRDILGLISQAAPEGEIGFESHEFNGRYGVWGPDRKFAYDVVDPRMMEFLLANPGWAFEVAGHDVMVYTGKRWAMEEFDPAIRVLTGFVERIPEHVWANWRSRSKDSIEEQREANQTAGPACS